MTDTTDTTTKDYEYWFVARRKQSGEVQFEAPMKRRRCRGHSKNGQRCSRSISLSYPYCWQHTKQLLHLAVRPSHALQCAGIDGQQGLYAYQPQASKRDKPVFRRGSRIVWYYGEVMDDDELAKRYQYEGSPYGVVMSPYAMELDSDTSVDAALLRGVAAYANSPAGTGLRANARLEVDDTNPHKRPRALLVASRNIYHGDEILTQYGSHYFRYSALETQIEKRPVY